MTPASTTNSAITARLQLAARYDREAKQHEDMAAMADPKNVSTRQNLINIAQRKRTYAATARRMAGAQPTADDAAVGVQ
jgi:hypothetical protein